MNRIRWTSGLTINLVILGLFIFTALFAPFLANDKALICRTEQGWNLPVFKKQPTDNCQPVLNPLIQYNYNSIDENNANFKGPFEQQYLAPGQQRHLLGTDQLGRDVSAGMIHGSRVALLTGGLSMLIAVIIGMLFGLIGGFYGNDRLMISRYSLLYIGVFLLFLVYFVSFPKAILYSTSSAILFFGLGLLLILLVRFGLAKIKWFRKKLTIPIDLLFSNFIEIFQSLPGSFLILILVSLFTRASIYNVILVIGLLRWPMIARYVRAEMLKIKEQRYIEASRAIGMSDWRIIIRHAMPATLTPVIVALAFGFSSAILLESTLSFLGIGLPADHVSFGSMLSEARKNYEAWWLAVFPGLAIFALVYIFNYLGDHIGKVIDRK